MPWVRKPEPEIRELERPWPRMTRFLESLVIAAFLALLAFLGNQFPKHDRWRAVPSQPMVVESAALATAVFVLAVPVCFAAVGRNRPKRWLCSACQSELEKRPRTGRCPTCSGELDPLRNWRWVNPEGPPRPAGPPAHPEETVVDGSLLDGRWHQILIEPMHFAKLGHGNRIHLRILYRHPLVYRLQLRERPRWRRRLSLLWPLAAGRDELELHFRVLSGAENLRRHDVAARAAIAQAAMVLTPVLSRRGRIVISELGIDYFEGPYAGALPEYFVHRARSVLSRLTRLAEILDPAARSSSERWLRVER